MKIVKVIKDSYQEYCGKHSLVLFSYGCNLDCSYCYNKEFVNENNNIIKEDISDIIKQNITPLHEAVVFLGGEPTSNSCKLIKALNICKELNLKTKLFTNGINNSIISYLCKNKKLDSISVDFKGIRNIDKIIGTNIYSDEVYKKKICSVIEAAFINNIHVEVRITKNEYVDDEHVLDIFNYLKDNILGIDFNLTRNNSDSCSRDWRLVSIIIQEDFRKFIKY